MNQIVIGSSEKMDGLPEGCIHLMVTSPPYNVGKEYEEDLDLGEHLDLLGSVFAETYRVLVDGGRACVNLANLGRRPYVPMSAHVSGLMISLGFLMRGQIIWDKSASVGKSTAWGSWVSASNPVLRDVHEYILVFSKGSLRRDPGGKQDTISPERFAECTQSIWRFQTESAKRVGHPAPFPVELPRRLIELYAFQGDVVLDPFMGSGTTAVAAVKTGRHFVGYEIQEEYADRARRRIGGTSSQISLFT